MLRLTVGCLILLAFGMVVGRRAAAAQPTGKVYRIGFLSEAVWPHVPAILEALRGLGYVEGHNLVVERRDAKQGEPLSAMAAELVTHQVARMGEGNPYPSTVSMGRCLDPGEVVDRSLNFSHRHTGLNQPIDLLKDFLINPNLPALAADCGRHVLEEINVRPALHLVGDRGCLTRPAADRTALGDGWCSHGLLLL